MSTINFDSEETANDLTRILFGTGFLLATVLGIIVFTGILLFGASSFNQTEWLAIPSAFLVGAMISHLIHQLISRHQ